MKQFEEPKFEVITLSSEDVITTSDGGSSIYNLNPTSDGYNDNNTTAGGFTL